ncbi:protein of unknown function DUF21 [Methanohalobium evestigatum Z-7303]|uniref:CNNM transmembrane domain-containing protein n=1 Tax=Methanohalobium evestigatum (strain ATCC BAA-1072 / DSM 3721 / NBRC 107634 / OCM 161 / Z-7303) TaxID=644295 RepID=D7E916_METEZ|nr:DUF21 domain-containing protein [Methanohalobium evestigatum]ADI73964.1 protein of unknown function DUF21 [Methanohalobium evestigatum Z-7303]
MDPIIIWILIIFCLSQSAIFSGLTIGLFGLSRLGLEIEAETRHKNAIKILQLRRDANFLLTTLLWGNMSVNVLLTLLTNSIMAGATAFLFSTFSITLFGEIAPQAYFTRYALKVGGHLVPIVKIYQVIFYPVAKPSAILLDKWLGKERMQFFKEEYLRIMLEKHIESSRTEISKMEGLGALNFLQIDDISISQEGSIIDPDSVITLPFKNHRPVFPDITRDPSDPFLQKLQKSDKKWVIITDSDDEPVMVLDSDAFLRDVIYKTGSFNPFKYAHRPIVVRNPDTKLDKVINQLIVFPEHAEDDVIDKDLVIYWNKETEEKRIITGKDILGRLLRGIVIRVH